MRRGDAEHPDDRVADELLDDAAVGDDRGTCHPGVGLEHAVDVLGVRRLGHRGEADEVAEQDADDLALLEPGHRPRLDGVGPLHRPGERVPARRAEPRPIGALGQARRADDHGRNDTGTLGRPGDDSRRNPPAQAPGLGNRGLRSATVAAMARVLQGHADRQHDEESHDADYATACPARPEDQDRQTSRRRPR